MSIKKISLIVLPLAVVLGTTACGNIGASVEPQEQPSQAQEAEEDLSEEETDMGEESPGETDAKFGETMAWEDGLSVTVSHEDTVTLSEVGSAGTCVTGDTVEVFTIKVQNDTDEMFSPANIYGFEAVVTRGGEDVTADEVFDTAGYGHNYELTSFMDMPDLRPGRASSITSGYCTVDEGLLDDLILVGDFDDYESESYRDLVYFSNSGVGGF